MRDREKAWGLLSDLYADATYSEVEMTRLSEALKQLNYSLSELRYMFKTEVGPVAGRWMCRPGTVGPWPAFDQESLTKNIVENLSRPWYKRRRRCLGAVLVARRNWDAMESCYRRSKA